MTSVSPFIFWVLSAVVLAGAYTVVRSDNIFHAGIALIGCFLGIAGLYITLGAAFVAGLQVLIYAGAIAVLLLFAFMLTHNIMHLSPDKVTFSPLSGGFAAGLVFILLSTVVIESYWKVDVVMSAVSLTGIARSFLTTYLIPFELVSVLLLAALMGAIVIARKEEGPREENE